MSVRAYRVKEIKYAGESFNMWHDTAVVEYLQKNGYLDNLNIDGVGMFEVPVSELKNLLDWPDVDPRVKENINADIKSAQKKGDEFVLYSAF